MSLPGDAQTLLLVPLGGLSPEYKARTHSCKQVSEDPSSVPFTQDTASRSHSTGDPMQASFCLVAGISEGAWTLHLSLSGGFDRCLVRTILRLSS